MRQKRHRRVSALAALLILLFRGAEAQSAPDHDTRDRALASLVQIRAANCSDHTERAGTGFAFRMPGQIVTAHHVVGGCGSIRVTYERVPAGQPSKYSATILRVLAAGDLALLDVQGPPNVSVLDLASPPPDPNDTFASLGYQNGQPTAGDQLVTFSTGSPILRDMLPYSAAQELQRNGSAIDLDSTVLRFNAALQPGTSGGPIIDANGAVIGIVAGGLKAGAAPASWGWPGPWVEQLLLSGDAVDQGVQIASSYYTLPDMRAEATALETGRSITCGSLKLQYRGTRSFAEIAPSADDQQRLAFILQMSTLQQAEIDRFAFDIWTHEQSGATAATPSGYEVSKSGDVCIVVS